MRVVSTLFLLLLLVFFTSSYNTLRLKFTGLLLCFSLDFCCSCSLHPRDRGENVGSTLQRENFHIRRGKLTGGGRKKMK